MPHCCFGKNQFSYVLSGGIDTRSRTCVVMINVTYIEKSVCLERCGKDLGRKEGGKEMVID